MRPSGDDGSRARVRYSSTSAIEMGWHRVDIQRGVSIAGMPSVRYRMISNEMLPEPTMTAARNSVTGTPVERRM